VRTHLGASLGQRTVALGGSLSGNIVFQDSYDGGALGNVALELKPSANHRLTTTSIPLLWNTQVTSGRYDANDLGVPDAAGLSGCGDLKAGGSAGANVSANLITGTGHPLEPLAQSRSAKYLTFGRGFTGLVPSDIQGLPGYPISDPSTAATLGFIGIPAGLDDYNNLQASDVPGNNDLLGPVKTPFPQANNSAPGGFTQPPDVRNTVLRTNALSLDIAASGTTVNQSNANGPEGSQNIVTGKSGGQANLFGNIPGKSVGIDITASFKTRINSIIRVVDQDSFHTGLRAGRDWPAGVFNCRQVWTGYVDNNIPGVRLTGSLKIAPGLTYDGHLRIAKATVSSSSPARFAVAACLAPAANYGVQQNGSDTGHYLVPNPQVVQPAAPILQDSFLPISDVTARQTSDPKVNTECNTAQTDLVKYSGIFGSNGAGGVGSIPSVPLLTNAAVVDGYDTTANGSRVSVGADLNVTNVAVDVLIGDV